jgi:hypothetical protein
MVIVKISGGLGNQLFQYSFGRYLSTIYNTILKLDIQTKNNISGFTNRDVGLDKFNINIEFATSDEIIRYKWFKSGLLSRVERKLIQAMPFLNIKYIIQSPFCNKFNMNRMRDNCYYDGYWQSEKYFKPIADVLRSELTLSFSRYQLSDNIISSESVSLHVRRGDYLSIKSNSKLFAECSIQYYFGAINYILEKVSCCTFFIFSDDITWCKDKFKGDNFRYVESNMDCPEVDLFLMSQCKHNIIANSSFSWWGAWLNSNPDKIVIAPKGWYKGRKNRAINELIPSKWIMI